MAAKKLIVGNWKMNGLVADSQKRTGDIVSLVKGASNLRADIVLCPPFTLLAATITQTRETGIAVGAQDCHAAPSGAFTGNISAQMLQDLGCGYVIVGHSERRQYHGETDAQIKAKAEAAIGAKIIPIICVGETDAERTAGKHKDVVTAQIKGALPATLTAENGVIAYEPVWAIGTGKTASPEDIKDMHAHIRGLVPPGVKILYGGSVKAANAAETLSTPNVDGALVGGASLKSDEFWSIISAA
jgi:triosephosphate isomerase